GGIALASRAGWPALRTRLSRSAVARWATRQVLRRAQDTLRGTLVPGSLASVLHLSRLMEFAQRSRFMARWVNDLLGLPFISGRPVRFLQGDWSGFARRSARFSAHVSTAFARDVALR